MEQKITHQYPVEGYIQTKTFGRVPLLNIRMMTDERERELAARSIQKMEEKGA